MNLVRGGLKDVMLAAIPATIGGLAIGFVDAKMIGRGGALVRNLVKVVTAIVVGTMGRRWLGPTGSGIAMGAILGTIGHEYGIKLGGGMVAMSKLEGMGDLVEAASTDADVNYQLQALIEGTDTTSSAIDDYNRAMTDGGGIPGAYEDVAGGEYDDGTY